MKPIWRKRCKYLTRLLSLSLKVAVVIGITVFSSWASAQIRPLQKNSAGSEFNKCVTALRPQDLVDPGLDSILRELSRTSEYRDAKWNINRPYVADSINILVPQGNTRWPAACNLIAEPAGCESSPSERYIICNPPIGAQLASPLVRSGIANTETNFAKRFILMTFIGHELGHLSFHAEDKRYLLEPMLKWMQPYGMTCDQSKAGREPTEEERADTYGIAKACEALRLDPDFDLLPTDPAQVVSVLQRLQDELDDTYFTTDDACVREDAYPSTSRRKHTFLRAYLACLYPKGWNPVAAVAEEDASSFERLEMWLGDRQIAGFVASGSYSKATLLSHQIAKSKDSDYIAFDSSGVDSTLWYVAPPINGLVAQQLRSWQSTGHSVWAEKNPGQINFFIVLNEGGKDGKKALAKVETKCAAGSSPVCTTHLRTHDLDDSAIVVRGADGSVVVQTRKRIECYRSFEDVFNGVVHSTKEIPDLPTDPEQSIVATKNNLILVVKSSGDGFYSTIIFGHGAVSRRALFAFPKETGNIEAAEFVNGRLLLSIYDKPLGGDGQLSLWDCPETVLDTTPKTTTRTCQVYKAPNELKYSVAMATRDLSSLFSRSIEPAPAPCGTLLVIRHRGWLWLLDRERKLEDNLPADGLITCDDSDNSVETYRARRIDHLSTRFSKTTQQDLELTSLPQLDPK
jgi:hypothetical protein